MCDQDFKTSQTPSFKTDPLFYFLNRFSMNLYLRKSCYYYYYYYYHHLHFSIVINYNYSCSYTTVAKVYNRELIKQQRRRRLRKRQ